MTRLAFGGKCGPARTPWNGLAAEEAPVASRSNNPNRAAPPNPNAKRPKKSRRFIWKLTWAQFISSSHNAFIVVQQRFCQNRAGGDINDIEGCIILRFAHCQQFSRPFPVFGEQ